MIKRRYSINFIYAVFMITIVGATCTVFIMRKVNAVTDTIDSSREANATLLKELGN